MSRRSERLKEKSDRNFEIPDRDDYLEKIGLQSPSPSKANSRHCGARRSVNNFMKETNYYNSDAVDPLIDIEDDDDDGFIVDDNSQPDSDLSSEDQESSDDEDDNAEEIPSTPSMDDEEIIQTSSVNRKRKRPEINPELSSPPDSSGSDVEKTPKQKILTKTKKRNSIATQKLFHSIADEDEASKLGDIEERRESSSSDSDAENRFSGINLSKSYAGNRKTNIIIDDGDDSSSSAVDIMSTENVQSKRKSTRAEMMYQKRLEKRNVLSKLHDKRTRSPGRSAAANDKEELNEETIEESDDLEERPDSYYSKLLNRMARKFEP